MRSGETGQSCGRLLGGLSIGLCGRAGEAQRRDLEKMGRLMDASSQLKDTITNLKDQLARRATGRAPVECVDNIVVLVSKAS